MVTGLWEQLVDCICRPPRDTYKIEDLKGGKGGNFEISGVRYRRDDCVLTNAKGQKLQCSHFLGRDTQASDQPPITVYCHCNSGSRRDAEEAVYALLPSGISVFSFDFAGSGMSEGEWVTLGAHEKADLCVVVAFLRGRFPQSTIALWGRSMGAVTCLLHSQTDPSIAGMVLDSPFARLTELMVDLVQEQRIPIPRAFMRVALGMMRRSVKKRAHFNLDDVAPLDAVGTAFIPAYFGHAKGDTFVPASHCERLHAAYGGEDKDLLLFDGDHNSARPREFYTKALTFLHAALRCQDASLASTPNLLSVMGATPSAFAQPGRLVSPVEPPASPGRALSPPMSPESVKALHRALSLETGMEPGQDLLSAADLYAQQTREPPASTAAAQEQPSRGSREAEPSPLSIQDARSLHEAWEARTSSSSYEDDLALALQMSMLDAQQHSGAATEHAAQESDMNAMLPQHLQNLPEEDAYEMMLKEAVQASIIDNEGHFADSASEMPSGRLASRPLSPSQGSDAPSGRRYSKDQDARRRSVSLSRSSARHSRQPDPELCAGLQQVLQLQARVSQEQPEILPGSAAEQALQLLTRGSSQLAGSPSQQSVRGSAADQALDTLTRGSSQQSGRSSAAAEHALDALTRGSSQRAGSLGQPTASPRLGHAGLQPLQEPAEEAGPAPASITSTSDAGLKLQVGMQQEMSLRSTLDTMRPHSVKPLSTIWQQHPLPDPLQATSDQLRDLQAASPFTAQAHMPFRAQQEAVPAAPPALPEPASLRSRPDPPEFQARARSPPGLQERPVPQLPAATPQLPSSGGGGGALHGNRGSDGDASEALSRTWGKAAPPMMM